MKNKIEFQECSACLAKPGSSYLCAGCLNNRSIIETLRENIEKLESKLEIVKTIIELI